jgi:hypothetical protein
MKTISSIELSEAERNALRAFLQRCEVRLSTMHRVAGVFLNGAGLLLLFPIFFRDAFRDLLECLLAMDKYSQLQQVSAGLLLIAVAASLYILILALYNLVKDLVLFYFTGHTPGYKGLFNPRFALSALAFSRDESETAKRQMVEDEYEKDIASFVIPPYEKESEYFDDLFAAHGKKIIPNTRHDSLNEQTPETTKRYLVALGLSGFYDRDLMKESAKMETSLVKHNIGLRRLVLRYIKALLLFIWFAIPVFIAVSVMRSTLFHPLWVIAIGYLIWAVFAPILVKLPIDWIYNLASRNLKEDSVKKDPALVRFEQRVRQVCWYLTATLCVACIVLLSLKQG